MNTSDLVDDDEWLTRLFRASDWQEEKISSAVFLSQEVSVFRDHYLAWQEVLAQATDTTQGVSQITARAVRAIAPNLIDVVKDEPPDAHALILPIPRVPGKRLTKGQAKRLRDEAMKTIKRMPQQP